MIDFVRNVMKRVGLRWHPVSKSTGDFGRLAVPRNTRREPAPWRTDKAEMVRHFRGSAYIAISAIARKVAMQEPIVSVKRTNKSGKKLEPVNDSHPLVELLEHVNDIFTAYELWWHTVAWRLATGDSYWWKVRNSLNVPSELWVIPSPWVRVIPSRENFVDAYEIKGLFDRPERIGREDIVHTREPNLDWSGSGRYYGHATMLAGASMLDVEESMTARLLHHFRNYAAPGLHYETDADLTEDQLRDLYSQIAMQHSMAEHTGRPIVSHSGLKVVDSSPKVREMDYQKSLDAALEYQFAVFGVPSAIVGRTKSFNRANMTAALLAFANHTVNPLLTHLGQVLTQNLARDFDEKLVIHFKPCSVDDSESLRKDIELSIKSGAMTPNEIREVLLQKGPFREGGNLPLIQGSQGEATYGNEQVIPQEEAPQVAPAKSIEGNGRLPSRISELRLEHALNDYVDANFPSSRR